MRLPHPAHCYINPARSSLKAVIRRHHPSSLSPRGESPPHSCHPDNSCPCPRAQFWEVSPSSVCEGASFQRHQCYGRVHGLFEISHPKVTSRVYFLHLSALWETLFSPEIWHFLILACFPGQQPCSPALPAIQQRRVKCCHCLCVCLPSCWACLLRGQLEAEPGSQLLWQQLHMLSGYTLPLWHLPKHLKATTSTYIAGSRNWQEGNDSRNKETRHGQDYSLSPAGSMHLPPWPFLCHAHGHALSACTAQPPLLCWRLQPPQLNSRLAIQHHQGKGSAWCQTTFTAKNWHCCNENTQASACKIWDSAALGLTAFSKLQKKVLCPKWISLN